MVTRLVVSAILLALAAAGVASAQVGPPPGTPTTPTPPPTTPAPLPPAPKLVVQQPTRKGVPVREGQAGRFLLGGTWYFRLDDTRVGLQQRFFAQEDLVGWSPISLPHNWNGQDYSENRSSVGWYRKEFRVPRNQCIAPPTPEERRQQARERAMGKKKEKQPTGPQECDRYRWRVDFLGANHAATVYLNGRQIGLTHNGGYVPFEIPLTGLREGRNTLTVRVSTLRSRNDLTHWRVAKFNGYGTGGWWNFGGLQREVLVRRVDKVDIESMQILPRLPKLAGPAKVEVRVRLRWFGAEPQKLPLKLVLADRKRRQSFELGEPRLVPNGEREISHTFTIENPRLWQPGQANLYGLTAIARGDGSRSSYQASFGVRQIRTLKGGIVTLNGRRMRLRGASIHEDDPVVGSAWRESQRRTALKRLRGLGSTVTRAHYPLHPAMLELLDRAGILVWNQAPVYQLTNQQLDLGGLRDQSVAVNQAVVEANINHPSIFAWSIANELGSEPSELGSVGAGYSAFVYAASRVVRKLDDTRLVTLDRHSRLGEAPYYPALAQLDALGVNEYFGWYNASTPGIPESTTNDLLPWLDGVHSQYPNLPMFITEYGAEASRNGPEAEPGTFDFQIKWMNDHAVIHGARSFINGSMVWALKDFRVHPTWGGGNPVPNPPWNNKGLINEDGTPKPAYYTVARLFKATKQLGPVRKGKAN